MNKINYQQKLDELIASLDGKRPSLLLHSCCAPCSSYCLEFLARYFDITVLYYNPNISPEAEFRKRANEEARFIGEFPAAADVKLIVDEYHPEEFYSAVRGLENAPEGGERCFICYRLRLERAARYASEHGFDLFCTTLSISPMKNCEKLNEIGRYIDCNLSWSDRKRTWRFVYENRTVDNISDFPGADNRRSNAEDRCECEGDSFYYQYR